VRNQHPPVDDEPLQETQCKKIVGREQRIRPLPSAITSISTTSEYKGQVALTGLGTPNQMREYVEDGTVTAFALWNPADLGYLAAFAAKALIEGEIAGDEGDSFDAGKLGEYEVGADGVVLLGDPFVFDAENIGDFDFSESPPTGVRPADVICRPVVRLRGTVTSPSRAVYPEG